MNDAIKELLDQRDGLNSLVHLLLNELECVTDALDSADETKSWEEEIKDAKAVIEHAHKVCLDLGAKA